MLWSAPFIYNIWKRQGAMCLYHPLKAVGHKTSDEHCVEKDMHGHTNDTTQPEIQHKRTSKRSAGYPRSSLLIVALASSMLPHFQPTLCAVVQPNPFTLALNSHRQRKPVCIQAMAARSYHTLTFLNPCTPMKIIKQKRCPSPFSP